VTRGFIRGLAGGSVMKIWLCVAGWMREFGGRSVVHALKGISHERDHRSESE
jgi:hypothetical protein